MDVEFAPVTADRWDDLSALFGRGVVKGCFCMYFRRSSADCQAGWSGGNKEAMRAVVAAGSEPGLIAYDRGEPVGWVSVAPREEFLSRLERSRSFKPVPGDGVWSVLCFYVKPGYRGAGLAAALLDAAVAFARERGAKAVEGAPVDPDGKRASTGSAYTGVVGMFQAAGFAEIERRPHHPVYRLAFDHLQTPGGKRGNLPTDERG